MCVCVCVWETWFSRLEEGIQNGRSVWHMLGSELSVNYESACQVGERVSGRSIMVAWSVLQWGLRQCTNLKAFELLSPRERLMLLLCFHYLYSLFRNQGKGWTRRGKNLIAVITAQERSPDSLNSKSFPGSREEEETKRERSLGVPVVAQWGMDPMLSL